MLLRKTFLRSIGCRLLFCIALLGFTGCAVSRIPVTYGVETGKTLSADDYARLQRIADALPGESVVFRTRDGFPPLQTVPLVRYAYSFREGTDLSKLNEITIGPFVGAPGEASETATALPAKLAQRLTDVGFKPRIGQPGVPDAYVLSGTVTRADTLGHAIDAPTFTQVEATVSRSGKVLGVMQANTTVAATTSLSLVVQALSLAFQDSRAQAISARISEALQRAKSGQERAALGGSGMSIPAPAGAQYRQAPAS